MGKGANRRAAGGAKRHRRDLVRGCRVVVNVGRGRATPRRGLDRVGAVADEVVVVGQVTPGAAGVLQLIARVVPEALVPGRRHVVPDVGDVEIIGAGQRPPDDVGAAFSLHGEAVYYQIAMLTGQRKKCME